MRRQPLVGTVQTQREHINIETTRVIIHYCLLLDPALLQNIDRVERINTTDQATVVDI